MSYGVGRRRGSDLASLWLWCRPEAVASMRLQAWELPDVADVAKKKKKKLKATKRLFKTKKGNMADAHKVMSAFVKMHIGAFPGGLVVRIQHLPPLWPGFSPWSGS